MSRSYHSVVQSKASESRLNETLQARSISKQYPKYFLGRRTPTQALHVARVCITELHQPYSAPQTYTPAHTWLLSGFITGIRVYLFFLLPYSKIHFGVALFLCREERFAAGRVAFAGTCCHLQHLAGGAGSARAPPAPPLAPSRCRSGFSGVFRCSAALAAGVLI